MSIIDTIDRVCRELARDPLMVEEVAEGLGASRKDFGGNIIVEPGPTGVTRASVVRIFGSETPSHVNLTLERSLSLTELRMVFGEGRRIPGENHGRGELVMFEWDGDGQFTVTIVAGDLVGESAGWIILRRDIA